MTETRKELLEAMNKMFKAEKDLVFAKFKLVKSEESLAKLEEKFSVMLQREIRALGVLDNLSKDGEVALGDLDFA
ncbi:hypothetical protein PV08_08157 [Exophiala spinifera]|uniref:Uncharacterized protein n=1 Tax=Exophiala spinifera TaxID=91928 RepID=A0A0D2B2Y6_9EURO|nr:uncharacterized protein PV08_08157 [Exophiala spinifera]KIW12970.1 hypothetical protein PV08_08157 [Exophiala spinifera]